MPGEGDALQMWWGQHSACSSTTVACTFPCKTPEFQLKAERNPFSPPPLPLQSVDLFRVGKGIVFTPFLGGLGAGSRKPSPPGQVVEEKIGEQDEKKCY